MTDVTSRLLGGTSLFLSITSLAMAKRAYEKEDIEQFKKEVNECKEEIKKLHELVNELHTINQKLVEYCSMMDAKYNHLKQKVESSSTSTRKHHESYESYDPLQMFANMFQPSHPVPQHSSEPRSTIEIEVIDE